MSRRGEKREQILTSALRVISRHGMRKTTMEDIAEAAHMRAASLYYYFKSKEEVFSAAIKSLGERYLSMASDLVDEVESGRDKLSAYMKYREAAEAEVGSNFDMSAEVMLELMPHAHAAMKDIIEADRAFIVTILQHGVDDGSFELDDFEGTAETIQACVSGVILACKTGDYDVERVFPIASDLFIRGLLKHPGHSVETDAGGSQ